MYNLYWKGIRFVLLDRTLANEIRTALLLELRGRYALLPGYQWPDLVV